MESIWNHGISLPSFPPLEGDLETDILIVGGGLAGLLCAYRLKQDGAECVLIEAGRICGGATGNTTAKITSQHGLIYSRLLKKFGEDAARKYWQIQQRAIGEYRHLAKEIDCDFRDTWHAVYGAEQETALAEEAKALKALGIPFAYAGCEPLPVPVKGAIRFQDQARFHPLKFVGGIAAGLRIYEHTPAREFAANTVVTDRGRIRAKKIIIATHFPILNKHGGYFLKLYQQRSYVLAVENAPEVDGMYLAAEEDGFSFRSQGSALLIGGGGHRTGKKSRGWEPLETFVHRHFPQARILHRWANQDCMTLDGLPYIGAYSRATPELFVATGFNKWGMTNSMAAAMLLTDLVQGRENPCGELFSPQRSVFHPQLAVNALESTRNLLTPTRPRCPHLGCALKWNAQERSWDCPCHGSRFSGEGKLLDGPATGDLPDN